MCDRVAILVDGKVRQVGTVTEVRRWGVQERRFRFEVSSWPAQIQGSFRIVADEPFEGHRRVTVSFDGDVRLDAVLRGLLAAETGIYSCERIEPDLEDAFSRIMASDSSGDES